MKDEITKFIRYIAQRYPGSSTAKHYASDLTLFHQFVGDVTPKEITVKMIDQFVHHQSVQGLQPTTINRRLSSISSFVEHLIAESEDNHWRNPVRWRRHSIRSGQHLPRDVTDAAVDALLAVIEDKRDRAMVMLMVGAGLRIGEVVDLKLSNLDITETANLNRLRVQGKGDKERVVWLTHEVFHHVQQWLDDRPASKSKAMFLNQHGRPLSVSGVQFRLKQHCRKAGIKLTAHQLRHTFARRLVENRMPVESLAKLLGHNQLKKTQRYIDGADPALRTDFFQAMEGVSQTTARVLPNKEICEMPALEMVQEKRPDASVLLEEIIHLAADLPEWLTARLCEHTIRRAARWAAHRVRPHMHYHFGSLCRISRWLAQNRAWNQLDQLHRTDLVAYVNARQEAGIKPRSIGTELTVFRMWWRDLLSEERVTNVTILQVKAPVAEAPLPRYLTIAEYRCLEKIAQKETAGDRPQDRLNKAWFYILAHAGLRLSEVRNLRLDDCDLVGKRLRVRAGKGNRDRVIPMTNHLAVILQAYLVVREPATSNHFLIYKNAAIKNHLIPDRLRRWGLKAGIQPMTPHRLRHTLATLLINQGMPIVSLQKFLGHQDINKTLIYARVHDETVKEQFATAMSQIENIPVDNWPTKVIELDTSTEQTFDSV